MPKQTGPRPQRGSATKGGTARKVELVKALRQAIKDPKRYAHTVTEELAVALAIEIESGVAADDRYVVGTLVARMLPLLEAMILTPETIAAEAARTAAAGADGQLAEVLALARSAS